jgi:hypothetical protein
MTTLISPDLVRRVTTWHRPLVVFALLMVPATLFCLGGLVLDDRVVDGAPVWLKPLKFMISMLLYTVTWAWMFTLQTKQRRWVWWTGTATVAMLAVETVAIVGQVVRGEASHFNNETVFDNMVFRVMGAAITVVWLLNMAQGVVLLRDRIADRAMAWAVRIGVVLGSVGIGLAFLMVTPTDDQLAAFDHGATPDRIGAHTVGLPDGGPGMPLTGWSTVGGDLRIPHFVGIHAMQFLPLVALALVVLAPRVRRLAAEAVRVRLVAVAGGAYAGLVGLVTWQALRGQSLIHPDGWTLAAAGVLVVGTALGVRFALRAGTSARELAA